MGKLRVTERTNIKIPTTEGFGSCVGFGHSIFLATALEYVLCPVLVALSRVLNDHSSPRGSCNTNRQESLLA